MLITKIYVISCVFLTSFGAMHIFTAERFGQEQKKVNHFERLAEINETLHELLVVPSDQDSFLEKETLIKELRVVMGLTVESSSSNQAMENQINAERAQECRIFAQLKRLDEVYKINLIPVLDSVQALHNERLSHLEKGSTGYQYEHQRRLGYENIKTCLIQSYGELYTLSQMHGTLIPILESKQTQFLHHFNYMVSYLEGFSKTLSIYKTPSEEKCHTLIRQFFERYKLL
jgi:hypothetical protein